MMNNAETNNVGRPTKYKAAFAKQAYMLCLLGATDKVLAEFFEISESTLNEWKEKHPNFRSKVGGGKIFADAQAAEGLFKRATGYNYDEVTFEKVDVNETVKGENIKQEGFKKKVVTKHLPPDAGAALNWLKNRQKDLWRDKHDVSVDFEKMDEEQLDKIIERLTKNANTDVN